MYPKHLLTGLAALQALLLAAPTTAQDTPGQPASDDWSPAPFTDFTKNILFYPPSTAVNWHTLYARSLQLPDESLLITWENYPLEPPLVNHPIWKSNDGGATWSNYSQIEDQVNGWGMRFQPFLYTLPVEFGGFPAGTILAAGVSCPFSLEGGVWIDLYASTDLAKTWTFISHVAYGAGPETIANGDRALWEPFLILYNNQIVIFYSDQTDPAHSQKLVHRTTDDLVTWSDPVADVAYSRQTDRPGMTTVAHIESTDKWIMTFEYCGAGGCRVHYKVADNPLLFDEVDATELHTNDTSRTTGTSGPYVIWTPHPDRDDGSGLIIISASNREWVFVGEDDADAEGWKRVETGHWSAYSRSLRVVSIKGEKKVLFANGGNFGPGELNSVACAVLPIPR
ncbi:Sialidase [Aspergillus keveii]|uniref:Sialidase n=1 Tax=Aspergillus keveii TaxID=714993 RepID=A0ABR4G9R4_9EURO